MDGKARRPSYNEANRRADVLLVEEPPKTESEPPKKEKCYLLNGQSNHYAEDGCYLLDRDLDDPTVRLFENFGKVLNVIGLRFDPRFGSHITVLRFLWLFLVMASAIYTGVYDTYWLLVDFHPRSAPSTYVYLALVIQATLAMLFLTHWQRKLAFESFFHVYRHSKVTDVNVFEQEERKHSRGVARRFWMLQVYIILSDLMYLFVMINGNFVDGFAHPRYVNTFYYPELRLMRPVFATLFFTILSIAFHTYLSLSNALFWEAKKFNYLLAQLKCSNSSEMRKRLEDLIHLHTKITRSVREMDGIFKIFAFMMTALVIPTTLFVLSLVFSRVTCTELLLSSPAVAFCVYEYYGIMNPSKLHEELSKSKAALCMNHNVWVPYEKSVNKVAHTLVMHLDQTDLGVSLWGFALVTRPLVLTTISAMMTCLAFFLELKPKEVEKMAHPLVNHTDLM